MSSLTEAWALIVSSSGDAVKGVIEFVGGVGTHLFDSRDFMHMNSKKVPEMRTPAPAILPTSTGRDVDLPVLEVAETDGPVLAHCYCYHIVSSKKSDSEG